MTEFEEVLQECLRDLEENTSSIGECLDSYPQYARELEPVLLTSLYLARGREARVSDVFKARVRARLVQGMQARPRKPVRSGFLFMRLLTGLAIILLALLAGGTVYAQNALPGDAFYSWKLASENAWRTISPDPVGTDIAIAERRVDELIAVGDEPVLYAEVLKAYVEVTARLRNEMTAETKAVILAALETQSEELNQSGVILPQSGSEILPPHEQPTLAPVSAPTATPLPILQTPRVEPTDAPQIVPTVPAPPEIVPTNQNLPEVIPSIEVPPLP
jgi:hypothetical protein